MKKLALSGIAAAVIFATGWILWPREHWPEHQPTPKQCALGKAEAAKYRKRDYQSHIAPYASDGAYFDTSTAEYRDSRKIKLDSAGLPMVRRREQPHYNPVTLSQYALGAYNDYLAGGSITSLIRAADKLIEMQRDDGAFPYDFRYRHYTVTLAYAPGWFSGMAQGQALSALGRAYMVTGEKKYLDAGNKALAFLQVRHPNGPMTDLADLDPSLSGYIFFQEYLVEPNVYTLNGFMFTLLGLHDWSQLAPSEEANELFDRGMETLVKILPYYDIGTFSAYDLSYITHAAQPYQVSRKPHLAAHYHRVHIELLLALYSVTNEPMLKQFADRWLSYVEQRPKCQPRTRQ